MTGNMQIIWTSEQLKQALGTYVDPHIRGGEIQFNSQHVKKGDIFIALKGGSSDGHNYVQDALKNGANLAIISDQSFQFQNNNILLVPDGLLALQKLAAFKRASSKAKFVAVTGSVGKTSTKEALKVTLSAFGKTFASRGNFNNNLGIMLNLASMPDDAKYAIIEMGMNHSGEIRELTHKVKPDIAIITSISEGHLEFFSSVAEIASSKAEIFEGLSPNGSVIIPADNQYYSFLKKHAKALGINNIYSFAANTLADAMINSYKIIDDRVEVYYLIKQNSVKVNLPLIAQHQALNLTICLLTAEILGCDSMIAIWQFEKIKIEIGRGKIIEIVKGNKKFKIISDYYNANPESMKASLVYLESITHSNKTAVLGDMLELGADTLALHASIVPYIKTCGIKKLFLIGPNMATIANWIDQKAIEVKIYDNAEQSINDIENSVTDDELILIKASKSMNLDKIVACLDSSFKITSK